MGDSREPKEDRCDQGYWKLKEGLTYRADSLRGLGEEAGDHWDLGFRVKNVQKHSCLQQVHYSSKSVEVL